MNQIEPFPLWLGHAGDGRDVRGIVAADIQAIIQLALEEPHCRLPRELTYCRFPLLDGAGNEKSLIGTAVATVVGLLRHRIPTLICCGAGRSRSPAIAAAALAEFHEQEPSDWLKRISERHPSDVSPGLWQEILQALSDPSPRHRS
jgi:protein-tyrosine phosphatase